MPLPATRGTPASAGTFDAALKEFYLGPVREVFNREVRLMQFFRESSRPWQGRRIVMDVNPRGNLGVGAVAEGGTLPSPGSQRHLNAFVEARYNYLRIQLSGPLMAAARSDAGAFVAALEDEMVRGMRDLKKDLNRQYYGRNAGDLCIVDTTTGGSITVEVRHTAAASQLGEPGTRYLRVGDTVGIGPSAGTILYGGEIQSITDDDTFVIANSIAQTDGDVVVRARATGQHSNLQEIEGLRDIVSDTGTYLGIVRATDTEWQANVLGNSGTARPLSGDLIQRAVDAASERGNGIIDVGFSHYSVRRAYLALLVPDKRYGNLGDMNLGMRNDIRSQSNALLYNDIPIHFDADCPYNRLYLLDSNTIEVAKMRDLEWADDDGAVLKNVSGQDNWEAFLRIFFNLLCWNPAANSVIEDITATL